MNVESSFSPHLRQRSNSEPLPRELKCVECGDSYRVNQNRVRSAFVCSSYCSMECLEKLQEKNEKRLKKNAREIVHIFFDKIEHKVDES